MIRSGGYNSNPPVIVSYPSYGYRTATGEWRINVAGIAFQTPPLNRRQKMLVRMLAGMMKASNEEVQSQTFLDRTRPFFVEAEKGQTILLTIGNSTFQLRKKTNRAGRFASWPRLSNSLVEQFATEHGDGRLRLRYTLSTAQSSMRPIECAVDLLSRNGLSVISDIDDTIKESSVSHRRELLLNTFVREFRSIDGMAAIYQDWYQQGADFHYVSSSPWQLLDPLLAMQTGSGFPNGTLHLRNFRLRDQFLKKVMLIRRKGKATEIKRLLKNLPDRSFILVGDSGEKDPEIYRKICRRFPEQIAGIFIREVRGCELGPDRLASLQRTGIRCPGAVFSTTAELNHLAQPVLSRFGHSLAAAH